MAVTIRLTRIGRRNRPYYRIVVTDSRAPRDGRYIECLGTYNSLNHPADVKVEEGRALYWLDKGAVPSDTVRNLLSRQGILHKRNLRKRGFDEGKIEEEMKKWEAAQVQKRDRKTAKVRLSKKAKAKQAAQANSQAPAAEPVASAEPPKDVPAEAPQS